MKKVIFLAMTLLIVLAGCASNETGSASTKNQKHEQGDGPKEKKEHRKEATKEASGQANAKQPDKVIKKEGVQTAQYEVDPKTWTVKPIDPNGNKKVVLITIDDAPDEHALEMAKKLKAMHVGAIFFLNGHFLNTDEKKQVVKKISDMGFFLGDHTYSHADLTTLSKPEQKKEMMSVYSQIKDITGNPPHFFRAPYGKNTDYTKELAKDNNMTLMNWAFGYDWNKEYENPDALTKIMTDNPYLVNGSILLMHDRDWTNIALKGIIKGLKKKGYTMLDPRLIKTQ
ncbi:peptidoglycan/xylan/chitin deacetylase (PgdA/CDA1 family) [Scopulibacillus darangshiensis]|uniref:Peptidoglycan/xylan/chitin deacetylase (PgdA/CDA1 family) n=1 Tax=Scopulibacillus darangshiensis TaxID=442528 RepID=A0A4R2P8Y8_9BACL|nr:polysaccharide deacetylase family protein [Scopulibacillus darangshiensis]TCP30521.1 peptidoglycan/xylan/chitin deacetylase (PgdA/CDA1 family) [Scopulibacillus darangshiensis]